MFIVLFHQLIREQNMDWVEVLHLREMCIVLGSFYWKLQREGVLQKLLVMKAQACMNGLRVTSLTGWNP